MRLIGCSPSGSNEWFQKERKSWEIWQRAGRMAHRQACAKLTRERTKRRCHCSPFDSRSKIHFPQPFLPPAFSLRSQEKKLNSSVHLLGLSHVGWGSTIIHTEGDWMDAGGRPSGHVSLPKHALHWQRSSVTFRRALLECGLSYSQFCLPLAQRQQEHAVVFLGMSG